MSRTKHSLLAGARDVAPILLGIVPFGLVAGAAVIDAGFRPLEAVGMSLLVNAGASQIAATSLYAEGAPLLVVLMTALVVNARMFIYSTSIAPVLGEEASWRLRPLLGHMLVDQNYATTMTRGRFRDDVDVVPYYVGAWLALASVWQVSTLAGALAGPLVPGSWGLDFAVPLVFLAMLAPALKNRVAVEVAVVTGIAAAVLVPVLPMQTGLIAAMLAGMVWGAVRHVRGTGGGLGGGGGDVTPTLTFWLIIVVLAVGTWAMRSLPIMLHGHVPLPAWAEQLLRYVPVAALTALVVPGSLYLKTAGVYHLEPPRVIAALAAMAVALRTKNVAATLAVGMAVLWLAQTALPLLG